MEYFLILVLELLGIIANAGQIIIGLDKEKDDDKFGDVAQSFWNKNRASVLVSLIVILPINLIGHYILANYSTYPSTIENYDLYSFALALVLGYCGQWLLYEVLNKMKEKAKQKADNLIGK